MQHCPKVFWFFSSEKNKKESTSFSEEKEAKRLFSYCGFH